MLTRKRNFKTNHILKQYHSLISRKLWCLIICTNTLNDDLFTKYYNNASDIKVHPPIVKTHVSIISCSVSLFIQINSQSLVSHFMIVEWYRLNKIHVRNKFMVKITNNKVKLGSIILMRMTWMNTCFFTGK